MRDLAGISGREMSRRAKISQPKVSRIDRGQALPSKPEAEKWLDECRADDATRERVLALLEAALGETRPWRDLLEGKDHLQGEVAQRNGEARLVRNFQPTVIPGLLQTAEYARAILSMGRTDVPSALQKRLENQQILHDEGRRFEFVLAEHVLHWAPGRRALAGQMDRLASLATLGTVEIAILPEEAIGVVPWHNFVIREPADGSPTYVTTELIHGPQNIQDEESVAIYTAVWDRLWKAGAVGDEAVEIIRRAA